MGSADWTAVNCQRKPSIYASQKFLSFTATKDGAILRSAKFNYQLNDVSIVVHALKSGDEFTKEMETLDVFLSSTLGISLSSKEIYATHVEYVFVYKQPERLYVTSLPLEDDSLKIKIYDDFVIDLRKTFPCLYRGPQVVENHSLHIITWLVSYPRP